MWEEKIDLDEGETISVLIFFVWIGSIGFTEGMTGLSYNNVE